MPRRFTSSAWTAPLEELARHLVAVNDGITTTWLADHDTEAAKQDRGLHGRREPAAEDSGSNRDLDRTRRHPPILTCKNSSRCRQRQTNAGRIRQAELEHELMSGAEPYVRMWEQSLTWNG
ncbi:hypothetical protein [Streptomyces sp. DT203]|uniref:hypothetical protein n=1 Tax=Streptomyces sp. DT203 TaxID=3393424 RepID=UPI003CEEC52A